MAQNDEEYRPTEKSPLDYKDHMPGMFDQSWSWSLYGVPKLLLDPQRDDQEVFIVIAHVLSYHQFPQEVINQCLVTWLNGGE